MKTTNKTPATKTPRTSTRTAAAKKSPAATAKTKTAPAPLTSPRVTKAAANAKKALTLAPEIAKTPKPVVTKKAKALTKPKASTAATPQAAVPTPPASVRTTIEAFIDVGFGNRLTLRGEGAELSWERGLTMNCLGNAEWVITLEGDADAPLAFKFLLNDEHWSVGENYTLAPGKTGAFTPEF